jgi:hypothetical protein
VGPPPERAFCKKHIGRVYTEAEIQRLSNGQGLPVRYYMGGYNCRHRWVLASGEEAERRMTDAELRPRSAASPETEVDGGSSSSDNDGGGAASGGVAAGGGARAGSGRGGGSDTSDDSASGSDDDSREERKQELRSEGYADFTDAQTNDQGFVARHPQRPSTEPEAFEDELALFDAEQGREVLLLPEGIGSEKSVDAKRDGLFAEYKVMAEAENVHNSMRAKVLGTLNKASEQQVVTDLVLYMRQKFDPEAVTSAVVREIERRGRPWRIRRVSLRAGSPPDFQEQTLTREQLLEDGKRFRRF